MDAQIQYIVDTYIGRLHQLFSDIRSWVKDTSLAIQELSTDIIEEKTDAYKAPLLIISDENHKEIAKFRPAGAFIIAAKGRVDIEGYFDKEILVYLEDGGPAMKFSVSTDADEGTLLKKQHSKTFYFYKGVDKPGWYWIENARRGKALVFDKELFADLIAGVSDYDM